MTADKALHAWFSQFLTAYPASSVPEDAVFPYLTYTPAFDGWGGEVSLTVNLWYYGTGEAEPNALAAQIAQSLLHGGALVPCDGGAIWLKPGSPWCQSVVDQDMHLKRRYLNLTAEYLTP